MACPFCAIGAGTARASFVYTDDEVLAFMDIRPVSPGHVLIVPREHFASFSDVPPAIAAHMFLVAQRLADAVRRSGVRCEGILLTLADGAAAGQEVPHCHLHVIPRFAGDNYRLSVEWSNPARAELDALALEIARLHGYSPPPLTDEEGN